MLAAESNAHILLGVCPACTRDDCTRYSARAPHRTVILPEAHTEKLSRPTPVPHIVTATATRTQAKLLPIESGGRSMGCHVATTWRLHGHRFHGVLVTLGKKLYSTWLSDIVYFSTRYLTRGSVMYRINTDKAAPK